MRVLVTGPLNPVGSALVRALAQDGHEVRAFGVPVGADPFHGLANVQAFPGDLGVGGSVEPVASECQALVHAAALDAADGDRTALARHIEGGTRHARFAAERELVRSFIALVPTQPARATSEALKRAEALVAGTRKIVPHRLLRVGGPEDAVAQVRSVLAKPVVAV